MKYVVCRIRGRWAVMHGEWKVIASFTNWSDALDMALDTLKPEEKTVGGLYVPAAPTP